MMNNQHLRAAPPPFLMGAALLFWGLQSGFLVVACMMALVIEGARWVSTRWDLADEDFHRIWFFCAMLALASAVFAFASNDGVANFRGFLASPTFRAERNAGVSTARTIASLVRWLPMIFFLFVAAQTYSVRGGVPLEVISRIMRLRWRGGKKAKLEVRTGKVLDISYPYFGLCLISTSVHYAEDRLFFWGLCVLLGWAMWPLRSRRAGLAGWAAAMGLSVALGYLGVGGLNRLQRYLETLNPLWFTGMSHRSTDADHSVTAMGKIGQIKLSPVIVIRVEPKDDSMPPSLLREAVYKRFVGKTYAWDLGRPKEEFTSLLQETNETSYILVRDKIAVASATISAFLPGGSGVLPLPHGVSRLDSLLVYELERNPVGTIRARGPGVVVFDTSYGPGPVMDAPPDREADLDVSEKEKPALDAIIQELQITTANRQQVLQSISKFFAAKFGYTMWQARSLHTATNETALSRFLLRSRKGHCEYFATATVLLLRELGIPARYAVGYALHEQAGKNKYVVRQRDAHAWALVWNEERQRWDDFDTTPGTWIQAEAVDHTRALALLDFWSEVKFQIQKVWWGQSHLRQYVLYALIPVLLLLLYQIFFRTSRKRRKRDSKRSKSFNWPGLDSELYALEKKLAERGIARSSAEPLATWLVRAASAGDLEKLRPALHEALTLHYRYRFDPAGLKPEERARLRNRARECLHSL